jgi:hypothetical protein
MVTFAELTQTLTNKLVFIIKEARELRDQQAAYRPGYQKFPDIDLAKDISIDTNDAVFVGAQGEPITASTLAKNPELSVALIEAWRNTAKARVQKEIASDSAAVEDILKRLDPEPVADVSTAVATNAVAPKSVQPIRVADKPQKIGPQSHRAAKPSIKARA